MAIRIHDLPYAYNKAGVFFIAQNIVLPPLYLLKHLIEQNENPYLNDFIEQAMFVVFFHLIPFLEEKKPVLLSFGHWPPKAKFFY
jgi:hypothetical protein